MTGEKVQLVKVYLLCLVPALLWHWQLCHTKGQAAKQIRFIFDVMFN